MKIEIINKVMLCWDENESEAKEYHVLAKVTDCDARFPYKAIHIHSGHGNYFKNAKPLPSTKPRTIEDGLVYGDIIIEEDMYKRKVLGVCGDIVFISETGDLNCASGYYTLAELIEYGYTLYNEQPQEIVKLTIQDISEGRGIGIDPKLIRIKE